MAEEATIADVPIDADSTATQRQRKKSKPAPTRGDWSNRPRTNWPEAYSLWVAGEPIARIVEATGISESSLRTKASRANWPQRQLFNAQRVAAKEIPKIIERHMEATVKEEVAKAAVGIPRVLQEKIAEHFDRVLKTVKALHGQINDNASKRCEVEEIKSLSSSLDTLDRISRRTFGLDSTDGTKAASLVASSVTRVDCPIVEADVVSEAPSTQLQ